MKERTATRSALVALALGFLATTVAACTGEESASSGDLAVSVSGGAAIRDGFPHTEGDTTFAFADGWTVQYTKYVVSVGGVRLSVPGGRGEVASWAGPRALDLKQSASASLDLTVLEGVSAIRYDIGFEFSAVSSAAERGNISTADFDLMSRNGWSILVEGVAAHSSKGTVRFRIGLPVASRYEECVNGKDQTQGIAIEANKTTGVFIYSHAIHIFWDTLATGDEDLRFDAFAAVKGGDDLVTEEELKGQDLNDLRDGEGNPLRDSAGKRIFYNDGGRLAPGHQTLYDFVIEAVRASAHFNGVGLCKQQAFGG
jgi:hypothetical protein